MIETTLYIMVGGSGSGKTEFAKYHLIKGAGWYYVSRDDIRYSIIKDDEEYFSHEKEVYAEFIKRIVWGIKNDDIHYVIADATHLHWGSREKLLNSLIRAGIDLKTIDIIPVMLKTDIVESIHRNDKREGRAKVAHSVIRSMNKTITDPITDNFEYTAIMYVNNGPVYTEKPKFMYHKNDIKMKEVPIKEVLKK